MATASDGLPAEQAALKELLREPNWRLRNLYWITDKDGRELLFAPWTEQEKLLGNLWYRNIILKARQRGFSTLIQVVMLDTCLFNKNTNASIIAQDKDAATAIFRTKIKFAYDKLPAPIRAMNPLVKDSESELILANGSALKVATSARSGTLQWLHVSEFGKICAKYPEKAREILSGSIPAVDQNGIVCIESTAEGREGAFFEMTQRAREHADAQRPLSKLDFRFHFASWWDADEYELDPAKVVVSPTDNAYFARLEAEIGREISPAKRAWYVAQRDNTFSGDREIMFREYPSTPDEAFEQSTEGVYLADQLALARRQGRIGAVPYDPRVPVNTFWDLGLDDSMVIWLHQRIGLKDHFIGFIEGSGEPYGYYVRELQKLGYVWGKHYLPHDGDHRAPGSESLKTPVDMLTELGLRNIEIVPRTSDLVAAIQMLRDDFNTYWFDETACAEGLKHLAGYRKDWNERLGVWSERPRKNGHQHAADALRQKAQGYSPTSASSGKRRNRNRSAMAV
ncbi:MAG: hypothetical protein GEU95_01170 [Rhizobiales bacterium]|nr:hypothetical protein [Hyphomicrobiales bacterium]